MHFQRDNIRSKMVMNFDLRLFCENLKATKPPYECPVDGCGKIYKSYAGIQSHLYNYDHDSPENGFSPNSLPSNSPERLAGARLLGSNSGISKSRDALDDESALCVEIELNGCTYKINIHEPLVLVNNETNGKVVAESPENVCSSSSSKDSVTVHKTESSGSFSQGVKLPEAHFKVLDDYVQPTDIPPKPSNYYRFIEKTQEELDDEVEYDLDEEDFVWLELMNDKRRQEDLPPVSKTVLELLLDRFEKHCYFEVKTSKHLPKDEDAICSICLDGECHINNVILFCDLCNLAVHQECYGVPHIPEGSWICRRCLLSPSKSVECCLCPNRRGAFKQTEDGRWAHVICALWIPEVGFANSVFLEPIDGIRRIAAARWKLVCYICKQRGVGACIQCHKTSCYTAFHVTCAQHAGLYMKTEPIRDTGINGTTLSVRKTAFCDIHSPLQNETASVSSSDEDNDSSSSLLLPAEVRAKSRLRLRKARKTLAEGRNSSPILAVPVISPESIKEITNKVNFWSKEEFIRRLCSYWSLKRHSKSGVPLLRTSMSSVHILRDRGGKQTLHIPVSSGSPSNKSKPLNAETSEAKFEEQFQYCKKLRQQLEKVRLLNELVRKRERLKQEYLKLHQQVLQLQLAPFVSLLSQTLDEVQDKINEIGLFQPPTNDPSSLVNSCAEEDRFELRDIRRKLNLHRYTTVDEMASDLNSLISSLPHLNENNTQQLKSYSCLMDQIADILKTASQISLNVGFDPRTGLHVLNFCGSASTQPCSGVGDIMNKDEDVKCDIANSASDKTASAELAQHENRPLFHVNKIDSDCQVAHVGINRRSAVLHSRKAHQSAMRLVRSVKQSSENSPADSEILEDKERGVAICDASAYQTLKAKEENSAASESKPSVTNKIVGDCFSKDVNFGKSVMVEHSESGVSEDSSDVQKIETKSEESVKRRGRKRRRSESEILGNTDSDDPEESGEKQRQYITRGKKMQNQPTTDTEDVVIPLEPLDLVWAKCSGFPWYPALIIDPKMSKSAAFHNCIPLPVPPLNVLSLRRKYSQPMFLVSFFDPRRTWQWLPRDKLDPLGVDSGLDSAKLGKNKKLSVRQAVRNAYQKAIHHRCLVTGEPLPPLSGVA